MVSCSAVYLLHIAMNCIDDNNNSGVRVSVIIFLTER